MAISFSEPANHLSSRIQRGGYGGDIAFTRTAAASRAAEPGELFPPWLLRMVGFAVNGWLFRRNICGVYCRCGE
ncbi:MAG: hypothetical protein WEB60_03270 [Terrimicrobiaceae bacterium]